MRSGFDRGSWLFGLAIALSGCGDDATPPPVDAGPDARPPVLDGGGSDAGRDAATPDSGADDASAPETISRLTAFVLPANIVTLEARDEAGNPLVFDTGDAFDHDGVGGEDVFAIQGDVRYRLLAASGAMGIVTFGEPTPLIGPSGEAVAPDITFSGPFAPAGPPVSVVVEGATGRTYTDFPGGVLGGPVDLVDLADDSTFDPQSATAIDLFGTGAVAIVALREGDDFPYVLSLDPFGFFAAPMFPHQTCVDMTPFSATQIAGAALQGFTPSTGPDAVLLIDGTSAYFLQTLDPFCYGGPLPIRDEAGADLAPEFVFGWDYDGDGIDDLIAVDRVTR